MGGIGIVFYRDPGTPYLLVKEVLPDGPAFRTGLVFTGDRLVAINDFDLAWSGTTPRNQQPQLPGRHGTAVSLSFDRASADPGVMPDRFNVALVRDGAFYPDRLSSSPYRPFSDNELSDLMKRSPNTSAARPQPGIKSPLTTSLPEPRPVTRYGQEQMHGQRGGGAYPPPQRGINGAYAGQYGSATKPRSAPYGQPGGGGDDLDDLIQEISRNDMIIELQSKLNASELEHDRRIKDMQRNQAGLEELVRSMRVELENARDQNKVLQQQIHRRLEETSLVESRLSAMKGHEEHIRDLQAQVAKERVQRQAAERRITAERDSSQQKMQAFESDLRAQIRSLEAELQQERESRGQADARMQAAVGRSGGLTPAQQEAQKNLTIERDALAAQNSKYEGEVRDLRAQLQDSQGRLARAIQQRDEHTYTQTHSYTRAMEENKMLEDKVRGLEQSLSEVTSQLHEQAAEVERTKQQLANKSPVQSWSIPDLQAPAGGLAAGRPASPPVVSPALGGHDIEIHQAGPQSINLGAAAQSHQTGGSPPQAGEAPQRVQVQPQANAIYVDPHHTTQQMPAPEAGGPADHAGQQRLQQEAQQVRLPDSNRHYNIRKPSLNHAGQQRLQQGAQQVRFFDGKFRGLSSLSLVAREAAGEIRGLLIGERREWIQT